MFKVYFAQLADTAGQSTEVIEYIPMVLVAVVAFLVLKFVIKTSLIVVIIGTLVALVASGAISLSWF